MMTIRSRRYANTANRSAAWEEIVRKIRAIADRPSPRFWRWPRRNCAKAQDFPTRPVRIVVAFPPGGPTDFVGRMVADKMTTLLGQRVYIDNKPGANGTLGGGDVAKSDPDGYSLFLTTAGAVTVSPHIMAKMPFDTLPRFRAGCAGHQGHRGAGGVAEARHQDRQRTRRAGQAKARRHDLRLDRHRLAAASRADIARPPRA